MVSGCEIKIKIKSVQNICKVMCVLEMVLVFKICKVQDWMKILCLYVQVMKQVIGYLVQVSIDYQYLFLVECEQVKWVGFIVIFFDCGLVGGLNNNLFCKMLGEVKVWQDKGVEVDLVIIGQKVLIFFCCVKVNMVGSVIYIGDVLKLELLIGVIKVMFDVFIEGKIDCVYLVYNCFVNIMVQKVSFDQLLLLLLVEKQVVYYDWDYLYEFDVVIVFEYVMMCYIELLVYQVLLENVVFEYVVCMVVMKVVSDNVNKLIGILQFVYNKVCQVVIIQEIFEIVGGVVVV